MSISPVPQFGLDLPEIRPVAFSGKSEHHQMFVEEPSKWNALAFPRFSAGIELHRN
jgi:hypothetical protein